MNELKEKQDDGTLKVQIYQNSANCYMNLKQYQEVIQMTNQALSIHEKAIKALFLRSQAYQQLKMWEPAQTDLKECIKQ